MNVKEDMPDTEALGAAVQQVPAVQLGGPSSTPSVTISPMIETVEPQAPRGLPLVSVYSDPAANGATPPCAAAAVVQDMEDSEDDDDDDDDDQPRGAFASYKNKPRRSAGTGAACARVVLHHVAPRSHACAPL